MSSAGRDPSPPVHNERNVVPFFVHQIVEMLIALLLLVEGARTGEHVVPVVTMGAVVLLASLLTDGPLGAWAVLPRRAHRWIDLALALLLVASPLAFGIDEPLGIAVVLAAAATLAWLAWRTDWSPKRARVRSRKVAPPPAQTSAAPTEPAPPRPPVARTLGAAVGRAGREGPRKLGRAVGRARQRSRKPPPS
jgi:hypothetical protein